MYYLRNVRIRRSKTTIVKEITSIETTFGSAKSKKWSDREKAITQARANRATEAH